MSDQENKNNSVNADIFLKELEQAALSRFAGPAVVTPLLLFQVLLDKQEVIESFQQKDIGNPEALKRHVNRLVAAESQGKMNGHL